MVGVPIVLDEVGVAVLGAHRMHVRGGGSIKTARASKHYLIFIYLLYQYLIIAWFVEYKVYIHIYALGMS